jgi:hypothetical protein
MITRAAKQPSPGCFLDVLRNPWVQPLLAGAAHLVRPARTRCLAGALSGTPVVLGLTDGLKMRGLQTAPVKAGAVTATEAIRVVAAVVNVLARL